jgi:hypothetical protein
VKDVFEGQPTLKIVSLLNAPLPIQVPSVSLTTAGEYLLCTFHIVPITSSYPLYVQVNVRVSFMFTSAFIGNSEML